MENVITAGYYTSHLMVIAWMLSASVAIFCKKKFIHQAIVRLGYPPYFAYLLGTAKLVGALMLALPLPGLFKVVALSGAAIELICACWSYYVIDKKITEALKPLVLLAVVFTAYCTWRLASNLPVIF
ncbi:hypothetical protein CHU92_05845 [Flavobacterium cyanobacteriorum]|uniref:DoxX family protein n=1 Tax=Flavobacterium cyanobacteriorum TaxID=2022802 RepID=A0A255Z9N2_9FLAO|nr:DoxX family protein [Flavobacterium cyanobacteriorum]OYQ38273.1 hypothetical protein CHU92_05845 [Flavobacterium cyanobacteriorum]